MIESTLCYITRGNEILMLHRTKKKNDVNEGKWIGIGGKFEPGETPLACVVREVKEETGLDLIDPDYRGIVTFRSAGWEPEHMHLFTADRFSGTMLEECDEGDLQWIPQERFRTLPQWEGDLIFLRLLEENAPFFRLELCYEGDTLVKAELNGKEIPR